MWGVVYEQTGGCGMKRVGVLTVLALAILCTLSAKGYCENNTTGLSGDLIKENATADVPGLSVQNIQQRMDAVESLIENKNLVNAVADEAGNITITSDGNIDLRDLPISTTGSISITSTDGDIITVGSVTADSVTISSGTLTVNPRLPMPEGENVISGIANISSSGMLNIATSDVAIINYNSFSIGASETIQFIQPSSSSIALNSIIITQPSIFNITYGTIYAPGSTMITSGASITVTGKVVEAKSEKPKNIIKRQDETQAKFVRDRMREQRKSLENLFGLKKDEIE